jgi:hypothetical protein
MNRDSTRNPNSVFHPDKAAGTFTNSSDTALVHDRRPTLAEKDFVSMHSKPRGLGSLLISEGALTEDQLGRALEEQSKSHERLGAILLRLGMITESHLVTVLSLQLDLPVYNPTVHKITPEAISLVPKDVADRYELIPVSRTTVASLSRWWIR